MNLKDAQLCIDCEWIYAHSSHCPRCASSISYPVARALDRELHSVAHLSRPLPVAQVIARPALVPGNTVAVAVVAEPLAPPQRGSFTSLLQSA